MSVAQKINDSILVRSSKFMYVWMLVFYFGSLGGSALLLIEGFSFESKYSFIYIFGGIVFFPIFLYLTLWALPALNPRKILLEVVPGEYGAVISKKGNISIKEIRNIELVRNPLNLINDIVIETFKGEKIKIRTYNLLDDLQYEMIVDQYIYPYMEENAKKVWDRKIDLERLRKVARYERKEPKIE